MFTRVFLVFICLMMAMNVLAAPVRGLKQAQIKRGVDHAKRQDANWPSYVRRAPTPTQAWYVV
ncbi:hypothetical protein EWM64_g7620 [Hericium alpestre]|uniref:Uncharacterized protein n=1 Tax=Hericium alpestre TaxID=135208 RepID=A0A4Y9ZNN1_9AGAM|nr:hypothetical protein EWM64_g7620 [Hericium alpestre]